MLDFWRKHGPLFWYVRTRANSITKELNITPIDTKKAHHYREIGLPPNILFLEIVIRPEFWRNLFLAFSHTFWKNRK